MPPPTVLPTGVPGIVLVVVLSVVPALVGPVPALGTPGDSFDTVAARPTQEPPFDTAGPVGVWPLQPNPEVVAGFDPPDAPWGAGHRGVDLLGSPGQPVRATLPGKVTFAGPLAGRGVVVVDHGDTRTTYEPVDAGVSVGDAVAGGGRIGRLQVPGSHCFPRTCLHWGWIRGETYLDPLALVGGGPVRLLPLGGGTPAGRVGDAEPAPSRPYRNWRAPVHSAWLSGYAARPGPGWP